MGKPIKVLMVEDSEDDAFLMLRELRRSGYDLTTERVETRQGMLDALKQKDWDIILSDYVLPQFGGLAALQLYKEIGLDIPFIVISGTIGENTAVEMMKAGVHDYLMKGNLARLAPAIERELQEAKSRREKKLAEAALHASEARARTIFDTAPSLLNITDKDGHNLLVSPSCEEITGYTADELAQSIVSWVHPDDKARTLEILALTYREGLEVKNFEFKGIKKDGQVWYAYASWKPYRDETGTIQGFVFQTVDITSRKRSEEELQRLNRALRATSECNQALIRAADEDTLLKDICKIIVEVGRYCFAWIGYRTENPDEPVKIIAHHFTDRKGSSKSGMTPGEISRTTLPMLQAIRQRKVVVVEDIDHDPAYTEIQPFTSQRGFSSCIALPLIFEGEVYGSLLIFADIPRAFDDDEITLLNEMASDISFGIHTLRLRVERRIAQQLLEESNAELALAYDATLEGWSRALELRERETAGHSQRVVAMTIMMARMLGIPEEDLIHIRRGALLHDIGKMGIPDSILLKPASLTPDE